MTLASVGMDGFKRIPKLYKIAFGPPGRDVTGRVKQLVGFAEQARREGLLALDAQTKDIEDDFTRKGMQLVVDGSDPERVAEVLEAEIEGMQARHHEAPRRSRRPAGSRRRWGSSERSRVSCTFSPTFPHLPRSARPSHRRSSRR